MLIQASYRGSFLEKFGRSEFQHLLQKFSKLKQTGSVLEYAEKFNVVMHSLLAHHSSWDPLFFTTQFLEGLAHDIKVAVMLHRPQDLETVVALAELQEEVIDMVRQEQEVTASYRGFPSGGRGGRVAPRPPLALPPPSPVATSGGRAGGALPSPTPLETRQGLDIANSPSSSSSSVDDKLKAL